MFRSEAKMFKICALLLLVVVAVVAADKRFCGDNCSGHGVCEQGVCECDQSWAGLDCSIPFEGVEIDAAISGTVLRKHFKYYYVDVPVAGGTLRFIVDETSEQGDVDEYVKFGGNLPLRNVFDYRDITTRRHVELSVEQARQGRWVIGIYGYEETEFALAVELAGACPMQCSGNGECENGLCLCFEGFGGDYCQDVFRLVEFGRVYTGELAVGGWHYYVVDLSDGTLFEQIDMTMHRTGDGDIDIYVRKGAVPTPYALDYWNVSTDATLTLNLTELEPIVYYIGLYGFRASGYEFSVEAVSFSDANCDNECSRRGDCVHGRCDCERGFSGDGCEAQQTRLGFGEPAHGFVAGDAWNWYRVRSISENALVLRAEQSGETGDCDLYVKADARPARFDYDFIDLSLARSFELVVPRPSEAAEWHIGVFGWSACEYTLTAIESDECECASDANGHCERNSATCVCDNGWAGYDCSVSVNMLTSNVAVLNKALGAYEWDFWHIFVDASFFSVALRERDVNGLLWLYLSDTADFPTLEDYDDADVRTSTGFHKIDVQLDDRRARTYTVGVYGNPYNLQGRTIHYDLECWSPPF
jgi:hypothetical protein